MMKRPFIFLLIGAFTIAAPGCGPKAQPTASAPNQAAKTTKVALVVATNITRTVEVPGSVEGFETTRLMSRIEGYLKQVNVNIGDAVTEGQLLAVIDSPEFEAEVERRRQMLVKAKVDVRSREAEVAQAQAFLNQQMALKSLRDSELERNRNLVQGGAFTQVKLEEAEYAVAAVAASIQRGEADVRTAMAHVDSAIASVGVAAAEHVKSVKMEAFTKILAPFDGLIVSRMFDPGTLIQPSGGKEGKPLFDIASVEMVRVILFVPMEDSAQLDVGDEVVLHSLPDAPGETFSGSISRIAKAFHGGSRMMRAEIDLQNPADAAGHRKLKTAGYGKVDVTLNKYQGIATVPRTAVANSRGQDYVLVVDGSDRCRLQNVEVAVTNGHTLGLAAGVEIGQRVIVDNSGEVEEGDQLTSGSLEIVELRDLEGE